MNMQQMGLGRPLLIKRLVDRIFHHLVRDYRSLSATQLRDELVRHLHFGNDRQAERRDWCTVSTELYRHINARLYRQVLFTFHVSLLTVLMEEVYDGKYSIMTILKALYLGSVFVIKYKNCKRDRFCMKTLTNKRTNILYKPYIHCCRALTIIPSYRITRIIHTEHDQSRRGITRSSWSAI